MVIDKHLYLDIEGTLIADFSNPVFLTENIAGIKDAMETHSFDTVNVFSWAITSVNDLYGNNLAILHQIEEALGRKFDSIVFRDNMFEAFKRRFGQIDFIEFEELCRSLGKEFVFQFFIRNIAEHGDNSHSVLIDDTVEDTVLGFNHSITIQTVKVP